MQEKLYFFFSKNIFPLGRIAFTGYYVCSGYTVLSPKFKIRNIFSFQIEPILSLIFCQLLGKNRSDSGSLYLKTQILSSIMSIGIPIFCYRTFWLHDLFGDMVFCSQNSSDLLWEKIVLVMEKNFWNSRLKAENLQNFWDH